MITSSPSPSSIILRSNIRHLYFDVFWWGILAGSTIAFLGVYATRLGATSLQVGLLTALPAVANLAISLPAGRWLEGRSLIRATLTSSIGQRAGYLLMILLPWLLPGARQMWALELLVLVMSAPGTVLAISFNSMFAQIVPPEHRGRVVGQRNVLLAIGVTTSSLLCGQLLDWDKLAFPLNYQVVFAIGVAGAALSSYHLSRIRAPIASPPHRQPARPVKRPWLRLGLLRGTFGPFMAVYLAFYTCQYIPTPLFPLAFVRELHLTDGAISLGNALYYASMLLASMRLGRMSERWGHRRVLIVGALLYGIYPFLIGSAHAVTLFWVASAIGGGTWALAGAGLLNRLMERVPPDDLPTHMALHNLVLNLGTLSGSLIGPVLGNAVGLRPALWIAGGLRLLSGALFGVWG